MMMVTMTTVATGDDDDGAKGNGAMGYKDDGDGRQATTTMATCDDGDGNG